MACSLALEAVFTQTAKYSLNKGGFIYFAYSLLHGAGALVWGALLGMNPNARRRAR